MPASFLSLRELYAIESPVFTAAELSSSGGNAARRHVVAQLQDSQPQLRQEVLASLFFPFPLRHPRVTAINALQLDCSGSSVAPTQARRQDHS
jgi:hypothetical protein